MRVERKPGKVVFLCGKMYVAYYPSHDEIAGEFIKRIVRRRRMCTDRSALFGETAVGIADRVADVLDMMADIAAGLSAFIDGRVLSDGDAVRATLHAGGHKINVQVSLMLTGGALVECKIVRKGCRRMWELTRFAKVHKRYGLFARVTVDHERTFGWLLDSDVSNSITEILEAVQVVMNS